MSLSKKEIAAIAQDSSTFYLYKDNVTCDDLIKIIKKTPKEIPAFVLLPIVKTTAEYKLDIFTDEVKYEMLYKIGLESQRFSNLQQIVDMFHMYNISIPDTVISKLVDDTCAAKMSNSDKDCQMWSIIDCLNPKFTKQNIENILQASSLFGCQTKMLEYILEQLIANKDFLFILEHKELFNYAVKNKRETAMQVVKNALDTKQLDAIAKQSKTYHRWENGILFSEDLIEQMVSLCMKEHRADLVFSIREIFDYVTDTKPKLANAAMKQLFKDKKEDFISSDPKVLSYILKHEPGLLKKLSVKTKTMETVKPDQTLTLLNEMSLPNVDLEFAYIKRNNNANAKFPPKEKLSPETRDYLSIITGKQVKNIEFFKKLTPRVISALIDCRFNNHADWYKIMEQLLIANPDLDKKFIQQMLNKDKKVEVLIKRHWNSGSRKARIKKFISEKKKFLLDALGIKQNKR